MLRVFAALSALVFCTGTLLADEIRGTIKKVDPTSNTITVMVGGKETSFEASKGTRYTMVTMGRLRRTLLMEQPNGMSSLREGQSVLMVTDKGGALTQVQTDSTEVRTRRIALRS